ncbi:MAG: helix-turn-helix domain-containing protein [Dehalococcoidia bacterium]
MKLSTETSFSSWEDARARLAKHPGIARALAESRTSRDVARIVIRVRKALALSQTELARQAGVTQSYIAKLESGAANPSLRSFDKLLGLWGYTLTFDAVEKGCDDEGAEATRVNRVVVFDAQPGAR